MYRIGSWTECVSNQIKIAKCHYEYESHMYIVISQNEFTINEDVVYAHRAQRKQRNAHFHV